MTRDKALPFVSFIVDDAGAASLSRGAAGIPPHARLVGWQCGFEPLFVAAHSYLPDVRLGADEAEELARGYLEERGWFGENASRGADYVI